MVRRLGAAALAVTGLIALQGCVLVGDSMSSFMVPQLRTVVPIVDADFGRALTLHGWQTQESGAQAVRRWEGMRPPWIIIQVGGNDVNATGDPNVWRAGIRNVLSSVPTSQCVAWVLVYDHRQPARSEAFNAVVAEELSRYPKHVLVPWPDAVKRGGMLIDDIHLSPLGEATMTQLMRQAVATFGRLGCR
jgi:lysophospholipase L1-like esterase